MWVYQFGACNMWVYGYPLNEFGACNLWVYGFSLYGFDACNFLFDSLIFQSGEKKKEKRNATKPRNPM